MLMFAWTARPDIPWIVPTIGLTVSSNMPVILPISLMVLPAFLGLRFRHISSRVHLLGRLVSAFILVLLHSSTDELRTSYGPYASSALAGQSLCRKSSPVLNQGQNQADVSSRRKHPSYHLPPLHDSNVRRHDVQMGRHARRVDSNRHDSHTICRYF
jgi:hypothetical protein